MSNAFVTIKMCYVYDEWYDISCAILYIYLIPIIFIVFYYSFSYLWFCVKSDDGYM